MSKRIIIITLTLLAVGAAGFASWAIFYNPFKSSTPLPTRDFTEQLLGGRDIDVIGPNDVSVVLGGDIMLSRNVASAIKKANDPDLPFRNLSDILLSSDFNFANLESPFSPCPRGSTAAGGEGVGDTCNSEGIIGGHSLIFGAPSGYAKGLTNYNFKIVSLANNHALDQGLAGLKFTKQYLKEKGILSVGTGASSDEAWQYQIIEAKDIKIGFLAASYASSNDGGKSRNDYVARTEDIEVLKSKVLSLKLQTDLVIVSMHAGIEYTHVPVQAQIDFAHAAIDAGADIVVGHHPHWVQPIEVYTPTLFPSPPAGEGGRRPDEGKNTRKGIIFYSLGNLVFDQEWSAETKQGLLAKIKLRQGKLDTVLLEPVILENYCCARPATEAESKNILNSINATSTIIKL